MDPQDTSGYDATVDLDEPLFPAADSDATEAPAPAAPAPATEDAAPEQPPAAESPKVDLRSLLETADPDELKALVKQHPRIRDMVYGEAGRIAQQQRDAEKAERDRKAQIDALRNRDPDAVESLLATIDQTAQRQEIEQEIAPAITERVTTAEARAHQQAQDELINVLPTEEQTKIRQAIYERKINSYAELHKAVTAAEREIERQRWEAEERPRIEQELLAKHRLSAPRPDVATGDTPRELSDDDFMAGYAAGRFNSPADHARRDRILDGLDGRFWRD